jgi:Copper transport outer membrane protein, MctB
VFDFRYHVVSLAAVFVALVIGIVVGLGLSGRGFIDDAERTNLNDRISELTAQRDQARTQSEAATRRQAAMEDYAADTYPALVTGRLKDANVAVLFVGPVDGTGEAVSQAVGDAGGRVVRVRAVRVPVDQKAVVDALAANPLFRARYDEPGELDNLGRDLAQELSLGGRTPLWDALGGLLVEEREGSSTAPADAIVVVRSVPPQRGPTKEFLSGLYRGVARTGLPAVGVQVAAPEQSAIPAFARNGLSTVDSVDTGAGRLALVLVLAGAARGHFGVEESATDGVLPPLPAAAPAR